MTTFDIQTVAALAITLWAALYVARAGYRLMHPRPGSNGSGCGSCGNCPSKEPQPVELTMPTIRRQ
jgi:hypothetical protein